MSAYPIKRAEKQIKTTDVCILTHIFNNIKISKYKERLSAEVNLDAIAENFRCIKKRLAHGVSLLCTVKANAYGHGLAVMGRVYEHMGADMLGVACISEARILREAGVGIPILILGYTPPELASELSSLEILQCLYSKEYARALSSEAVRCGVQIKVHIKLDSGMSRLGFAVNENTAKEEFDEICRFATLPGLRVDGAFTHFSVADGGSLGEKFTRSQFLSFERACRHFEARGIELVYRHCANSAAIFDYPEYHLNMVRAGIALYGAAPSCSLKSKPDLKEALTVRSIISNVKELGAGESVGYGRAYVANAPRRIATVPIGYADGLPRALSCGKISFTVCGKPAPTVGMICMDQTMLDITDIAEAEPFCEVGVFGADSITGIKAASDACGMIPYELMTGISSRVPRVYIGAYSKDKIC